MPALLSRLPLFVFLPLAGGMLASAWHSRDPVTLAIVAASLLMLAVCWASAAQVLGQHAALRFVLIACGLGWLAEQLGSTLGWFFGDYVYTPLLGLRLGDVPLVIPMMWFALTYAGFIMANLMVLLPLGIYGSGMLFQMVWGFPVETRAIAPFAMGIPLLCALAGYWRWRRPAQETL